MQYKWFNLLSRGASGEKPAEKPGEDSGETLGEEPADHLIAAALSPSSEQQAEPQTQSSPTDLRSRLIGQFEQWLDQMLAEEPPPRGVPEDLLSQASAAANEDGPAQEADLYTLFSALTSLTGEIRLQGRAFKQLTDLLSPLAETPAMLARLSDAQVESAMSIQEALAAQSNNADANPVQFEQICGVMIDLYDRLKRGLQTCDEGIRSLQARGKPNSKWKWKSMFGDSTASEQAILSVQGIRDASALTLARLQAALQEWGIGRVGEVGEPFDSERMSVVEVRAADQAEPGSVLAVNRSGYALNGILKVTAQVTVARVRGVKATV